MPVESQLSLTLQTTHVCRECKLTLPASDFSDHRRRHSIWLCTHCAKKLDNLRYRSKKDTTFCVRCGRANDRRPKVNCSACAEVIRAYAQNKAPAIRRRVARWRQANLERDRVAHRDRYLKRAYGITPEQFDSLMEQQGGLCAICHLLPNGRLCVDHDHITGNVRGLLCHDCNRGLGHFKDNAGFLESAISYMKARCQ